MADTNPHILPVDVKHCEQCGAAYTRSPKGDAYHFRKRRFCSPRCAATGSMPPAASLSERVLANIDTSGDCWPWKAGKTAAGYGLFSFRNRLILAHRASYEAAFGKIPAGKHVCHRCDNPACCRPSHLFLGTPADNIRDMIVKGRAVYHGLKGEAHHQAKLSAPDVLAIRASTDSAKALAARFNVCTNTVWQIKSRRTWQHI